MMADAHTALTRALSAKIGHAAILRADQSRAWASATFSGQRHRFRYHLPGTGMRDRIAAWCDGLDVMEFALPGHLVADILVVERHTDAEGLDLTLEVLTVEDA